MCAASRWCIFATCHVQRGNFHFFRLILLWYTHLVIDCLNFCQHSRLLQQEVFSNAVCNKKRVLNCSTACLLACLFSYLQMQFSSLPQFSEENCELRGNFLGEAEDDSKQHVISDHQILEPFDPLSAAAAARQFDYKNDGLPIIMSFAKRIITLPKGMIMQISYLFFMWHQ